MSKKYEIRRKNPFINAHRTKIIALTILLVTIFQVANAEISYVFKQNEEADIKISCFDSNNSLCSSATACQITILYPNSTTYLKNQSMTNQYNYYNYTLNDTQTSTVGEYYTIVNCQGTEDGYTTFSFEISPLGKRISQTQGLTSLGTIVLILAIAVFFGMVSFKLSDTPISLFFLLISLVLCVYALHTGYIYSRDILYPLSMDSLNFKVYLGIMWGLLAIGFLGLLTLIVKVLREFRERKSIQQNSDGWDGNIY